MKTYPYQRFLGRLNTGKFSGFEHNIIEDNQGFTFAVTIYRADITNAGKEKYNNPNYCLHIQKYPEGYQKIEYMYVIDKKYLFPDLDKLFKFAEEKGYCKRSDFISD